MRQIRIATRASKLATTQSGHVRDMIKSICPDADISFVHVSTKGDRDKTDFLYKVDSVGFFTSEVENALLQNQADIAVHSLKDLPTAITDGLTIAAIPPREQVCDVMVAGVNINSINDLPQGATVGTSSLRRIAQIKHLRSDLDCQPLRGNVETRVNKVKSGQIDAIIIAQAGLNRLSMSDNISVVLTPEEFVPAPGQGALAIQTRSDDSELIDLLSVIDDQNARLTTDIERSILSKLHGGCSIPLGVYSQVEGDEISLIAVISNIDATRYIRKTAKCAISDSEIIAEKIASELLNEGGREILEEIRNSN
ncbi:MAG: hydroxymethylbilane synthase [Planctomycetes bacterium]|nr:hydroxymethylbilane synthase [Planctomycetota bacterium]